MKYSIVTFGCRVNHADSLRIEEDLRARGGVEAPSRDADLVIVNTCSVTATADQGARQTIRRIARENPNARIVATGCYATRCEDEVAALPNVVRVVRNPEKLEFVRSSHIALRTNAASESRERSGVGAPAPRSGSGRPELTSKGASERAGEFEGRSPSNNDDGPCGAPIEPGIAGRTAFTIRAQTGCEEQCAYCIIPPMDCTSEVVDFLAASGRFLPHFHLPLQHASDRMLAAMRRPYTLAYYSALVNSIIARLPHASTGSDMIVGFPGETDEDFTANLAYLPSSPLTHLHVFPYSDRPGTVASAMRDKVHGSVIRDRATQLRDIGVGLSRRFRSSQAGTIRPGLTLEDGTLVVTDNYLKVRIAPGHARNERVSVRLSLERLEMRGDVVGRCRRRN